MEPLPPLLFIWHATQARWNIPEAHISMLRLREGESNPNNNQSHYTVLNVLYLLCLTCHGYYSFLLYSPLEQIYMNGIK